MTASDILVVLDLDETLIHASKIPLNRPADFLVGPYSVYQRPHVDGFLKICQTEFEVAVWTSASPQYAAEIVQALFPAPPAFVWASDRCTVAHDLETGEAMWIKNLKKLKASGYALERVIMVDDSPEKHSRNYGNLVQVRPWTGDETDQELLLLAEYLLRLRAAENIRAVEKRAWRSQVLNGRLHTD